MKIQTRIPDVRVSAAERSRLDTIARVVTRATLHPRSYRFINGLGTIYRVEAHSAAAAVDAFRTQHRIPGVRYESLEVVENGAWVRVI